MNNMEIKQKLSYSEPNLSTGILKIEMINKIQKRNVSE